MFNLSGSEVVIILLLALVVLGPEKLPEAIRRFGRVYGELKRMSSGFQTEFRTAIDEPMRELRDTARLTREAVLEASQERPTAGPGDSHSSPAEHGQEESIETRLEQPHQSDDPSGSTS